MTVNTDLNFDHHSTRVNKLIIGHFVFFRNWYFYFTHNLTIVDIIILIHRF